MINPRAQILVDVVTRLSGYDHISRRYVVEFDTTLGFLIMMMMWPGT